MPNGSRKKPIKVPAFPMPPPSIKPNTPGNGKEWQTVINVVAEAVLMVWEYVDPKEDSLTRESLASRSNAWKSIMEARRMTALSLGIESQIVRSLASPRIALDQSRLDTASLRTRTARGLSSDDIILSLYREWWDKIIDKEDICVNKDTQLWKSVKWSVKFCEDQVNDWLEAEMVNLENAYMKLYDRDCLADANRYGHIDRNVWAEKNLSYQRLPDVQLNEDWQASLLVLEENIAKEKDNEQKAAVVRKQEQRDNRESERVQAVRDKKMRRRLRREVQQAEAESVAKETMRERERQKNVEKEKKRAEKQIATKEKQRVEITEVECATPDTCKDPVDSYPVDAGTLAPDSDSKKNITCDTECVICWDDCATHITVPCGHLCVCATCGANVKMCPMCRTDVVQVMKVFVN
tara:strand:- start:1259 stop:2482 length:1224 start_codon:yes stop_codon:yes gene_type:complete